MPDQSTIRAALDIGPAAGPQERTIDITTAGAKSGEPRRIEIWFHQIDGRWYITGVPPRPRAWYANLQAEPHFTLHLKHDVEADLAATARPITDPEERRDVFTKLVDSMSAPDVKAVVSNVPPVEDWVASSPLVEVSFDDFPA
jgi:deazaflavin-dependent oxidoreductase (nitroreductase family)